MEIIKKLSNFFAPVEEEIYLEGGIEEEPAAVTAGQEVVYTAAANEEKKVVGGEPLGVVAPKPAMGTGGFRKSDIRLVSNNKSLDMKIQIYIQYYFQKF